MGLKEAGHTMVCAPCPEWGTPSPYLARAAVGRCQARNGPDTPSPRAIYISLVDVLRCLLGGSSPGATVVCLTVFAEDVECDV